MNRSARGVIEMRRESMAELDEAMRVRREPELRIVNFPEGE